MPDMRRNGVGKNESQSAADDQWVVDQAIDESFPASDPPGWTLGPSIEPAITPGVPTPPRSAPRTGAPWGAGLAAVALLALGAGLVPRFALRALVAYGGYRFIKAQRRRRARAA